MHITRQNRNVWLFIGFFVLAGIANLLSRSGNTLFDTLMGSINDLIFIGLLLFWSQSVRTRLLPTKTRSYILSISYLMLLYLLLRIFKYSLLQGTFLIRYAVYAYWIPQILIPTLFLITCIRIRRGEHRDGKWNEILLLIPAILLSLLVLTNDLHRLVYDPKIDLSLFEVNTGTYTYGLGFYFLYVWMVLATVIGFILLFRETSRQPGKVVRLIIAVIVFWAGMIMLDLFVLDHIPSFHIYNVPEVHIFSMLAIIEISIRYRLIPYNENYSGLFRNLHMPVFITDTQLRSVYRTDQDLHAGCGEKELLAALKEPVSLTPDHRLHGKQIRAGYAFWEEDESTVHQAQEKLLEANEMIEQENNLIQAETEQKKKDAYLRSRHHIYHEIAEKLYPCQKKIGQILDRAEPGSEDFRNQIAMVSVLNAYVKRKTNLLLLAAENEMLSAQELTLSLEESANYLTIAGLPATVRSTEDELYPAEQILSVYDAFEMLSEQLIGKASSMMVSWEESHLLLAVPTEYLPDTEGISLPVEYHTEEDILYMDIFAGEGGASA